MTNELLDLLCCYDLPENGLDKLIFYKFWKQCGPFEEEVISRLANICPHISHLELSNMDGLGEAGVMSMVSLFRQIIIKSPPIQVLKMEAFGQGDKINAGELVLEAILSSSI